MRRHMITAVATAAVIAMCPSPGFAQDGHDVRLHVNPRWRECAFQLDPSLSQKAWRQFTKEAGLATYFRPLAGAKPMGRGNFELSAVRAQIGIDDTESAWNDTFVHPDSTHWLFEGSGLPLPGLTARAGVTPRLDVGAYFARNPRSNYGFYGGQAQYNLVQGTNANWAASGRLSFVSLFGPEDLDVTVYGADLVASREYPVIAKWATVSPYAGVSAYLSTAHEKTAAVTLADEKVLGAHAMIGVIAQVSAARIAVEYDAARVRSHTIKVGFAF